MNSFIKNISCKKHYFLYSLIFIAYVVFMPKAGHKHDISCWEEWCVYIFNNGLSNIYFSDTNYLPVFHYILWAFSKIQGSVESIRMNINYLKVVSLMFEFISGFYLIKLISEKYMDNTQVFKGSLFYFLNISVFYNSVIWGQVDGIMTCFVFLSFYFAYKRKVILSLLFCLLALNFKLQSIVFLPFILLILIPEFVLQFSIKKLLSWIIIPVMVQVLILLPFILNGSIDRLYNVVLGAYNLLPFVSMNAFNMWRYFLDGNLMEMSDTQKVIGISYNKWGILFFLLTSFMVLSPLLRSVFRSVKNRTILQFSIEKLLIIGALLPLLFFYLNTQMHERYSHPAFIFLITYCILQKRIFLLVIASLAYVFNLECVLRFFNFSDYSSFIFSQKFIATLYLLTIILLFNDLFDNKFLKMNWLHN